MHSDIEITDVQVRLEPGQGRVAYQPLVERLAVSITSGAFSKLAQTALEVMGPRLPVDVELSSAELTEGGAEVVAKVKKSILKADLRVRLAFSIQDPATIRVRIAELDGPAWIPTQFVLENALNVAAARPGFTRVPEDDRAVDVNPAAVIASRGIPLRLASPGAWRIDPTASEITIGYGPVV